MERFTWSASPRSVKYHRRFESQLTFSTCHRWTIWETKSWSTGRIQVSLQLVKNSKLWDIIRYCSLRTNLLELSAAIWTFCNNLWWEKFHTCGANTLNKHSLAQQNYFDISPENTSWKQYGEICCCFAVALSNEKSFVYQDSFWNYVTRFELYLEDLVEVYLIA